MSVHRLFHLLIVGLLFAVIPLAACSPQVTPAPTATSDRGQALVGSWTSTVTKQDILRVMPGFEEKWLCDNSGTFVWKFNADGTFTIDQTPRPDCPFDASAVPHVEDKWSIDGNLLTIAKGTPDQEVYEIAVSGDKLTFKAKSSQCVPCIAVNTAKPWTKVE